MKTLSLAAMLSVMVFNPVAKAETLVFEGATEDGADCYVSLELEDDRVVALEGEGTGQYFRLKPESLANPLETMKLIASLGSGMNAMKQLFRMLFHIEKRTITTSLFHGGDLSDPEVFAKYDFSQTIDGNSYSLSGISSGLLTNEKVKVEVTKKYFKFTSEKRGKLEDAVHEAKNIKCKLKKSE